MTSRETAEAKANAIARAAEANWKGHRGQCPRCTRSARERLWDNLCSWGADYYRQHRKAQADLAENRRLDKLPSPDQEALFL